MTLVPTTRSIAGASARHPWRVIGVWVLMLVLAGVLQAGVGTRFNDNGDFTNNPDSKQADALLNRHMNADPSSETVGLPVALVVLVVVFAALVAPALPLLLGLISIFVAVGLTVVVSRFVTITSEVTIMISMIGLAVGIDYALFMVERYREERRWG